MLRAFFSLLFLSLTPAWAADHPCAERDAVSGVIASGDGDLFTLESSDKRYALAGIAAQKALPIATGAKVSLHPVTGEPDRYGRIAVHAFVNGLWLQGKALADGNAIADWRGEGVACYAAMLKAESPTTSIAASDPRAAAALAGRFVRLRGRVESVGNREKRVYLNFGQNWREDVTAVAVKTGRSRFEGDLDRLANMKGRLVEIRGTVEESGGPLVRLYDGNHIILLDGQDAGPLGTDTPDGN